MPPSPASIMLDRPLGALPNTDKTLKVTAIGSCRVVGPLRRAPKSSPFKLNQSGVFGYCHSSAEALQQISVLRGDTELPDHLLPVLAPRKADNPGHASKHTPSDMYIVELSSAKILSVDGYCIQLNYFTRHFESFFANHMRARAFWRAVRERDTAARQAVLNEGPNRLPADRYLLDSLQMEMSSCDVLRQDIAAIRDLVPNVLFVTHFDARKRDGALLTAREAYLNMLRDALKSCNATYFDPSDYVAAFGQSQALKDPDGSLSHYSDAFEDYLCHNWVTRYIEPLAQAKCALPGRTGHDNLRAAARAAMG